MFLTWWLNRRINDWARRRREAGSTSFWFKPIGYRSGDYSRRNQIYKAIHKGIAFVGLALMGSTIGLRGGAHLPGGWYLWVPGTAGLYLAYLICVRPWSAAYRERMTAAAATSSGLSPETEAWLAGAPPTPVESSPTEADLAEFTLWEADLAESDPPERGLRDGT